MKTLTKVQKVVMEALKELTLPELEFRLMKEAMVCHGIYHYKRIYCTECNTYHVQDKKYNDNRIESFACPSCKTVLSVSPAEGIRCEVKYFNTFDTANEFQIVRTFEVTKVSSKKSPPQYFFYEIAQYFLSEYYPPQMRGVRVNYYSDRFSGDLSFRPYKKANTRYPDGYIVATGDIMPSLTRKGYQHQIVKRYDWDVIKAFMNWPKAEILAKNNQLKVLEVYVKYPDRIEKYWQQIRICIRHKYIISNWATYADLMQNLEYLNLDITNPKFICPEDLAAYHRELSAKIAKRKQKEAWKNDNVTYQKRTIYLQGKSFTAGNTILKHLDTLEDIYEESEIMNHCLFSNEYYKKENSLLFRAYYEGEHVETVEIKIKPFEINQVLGYQNQPSPYNDIVKLAIQSLLKEIYNTYKNKNGTDRKTRKLHVQAHGSQNAVQLA